MMINSQSPTISFSKIVNFQGNSGKLAFPVLKNQTLYANFKHVKGVPASENSAGVPLSKLQVINALVDRILSLKNKSVVEASDIKAAENDPKEMERVVNQLKNELHQLAVSEKSSFGGDSSYSNVLVDLLA